MPQWKDCGKRTRGLKRVAPLPKSAKIRAAGTLGGKKMSHRFTQYILIAMALGIVMGTLVFNYLPDIRADIAADVNLIAMLLLRLIKMIIAPLELATLVGGIAHIGTASKLWRSFAQTIGWFGSA